MRRSGFYRLILVIILILVSIRILPFVARGTQAIAIGMRGYWWIVLPLVIVGLGFRWRMKKRELPTKKRPPLDVSENSERFRDI